MSKAKVEWWIGLVLSLLLIFSFGIYLIEVGRVECLSLGQTCGFYIGAYFWFTFTLLFEILIFSTWREVLEFLVSKGKD